MILRILSSTDGKFVGVTFNSDQQPIILGSFEFKPTKIEDIGEGLIQLSNSNYIVITEQS